MDQNRNATGPPKRGRAIVDVNGLPVITGHTGDDSKNELRYKDQTRNATVSSRQGSALIDLDACIDEVEDDNFKAVDDSRAAEPIMTSQVVPVINENEDFRNQLHEMQEELGQLKKQVKAGTGGEREDQGAATNPEADHPTQKSNNNNKFLLYGGGIVVVVAGIAFAILYFFVLNTNSSASETTSLPSEMDVVPQPSIPVVSQPSPSSSLVECAGFPVATTAFISIFDFDGSLLPTCLGQLTALTQVNLLATGLTGTIPSQLGQLTALTALSLSSNQLTGTIPSQLGQLTALRQLSLDFNQLTGTIPSQLGELRALRELVLNNNILTGTIPSQLEQLSAMHITRLLAGLFRGLLLHNNQLTGTVPSFVADFANADVSGNNFKQ